MFSKDANLFFEDPYSKRNTPGKYGILHLLRMDILRCIGINPLDKFNLLPVDILWPGTMAILAGIDLLGKFYCGNDSFNGNIPEEQVGGRFKIFVDKYFTGVSPGDKEILYQLRNSLLHSFGLYSKNNAGKKFKFILGQEMGYLVTNKPQDYYEIDIKILQANFEFSISAYSDDLENGANKNVLQTNFTRMFPFYGVIEISTPSPILKPLSGYIDNSQP